MRGGSLRRAILSAHIEKPLGVNRVVLHTYGGTLRSSDGVPAQHRFFLGGPVSAPGYNFHSLAGSSALSQRFELRSPVSFPSFSLGRYGRTPGKAVLAPYFNVAGVSGTSLGQPGAEAVKEGWYPSAGIALLPMFELVRIDVARGLRRGRWSFSVDVSQDFWKIL